MVQGLSEALGHVVSLALPILIKTVPWVFRKLWKSKIAVVRPVSCEDPIKVINSVAYGMYRFEVYNKRRATRYNKYSLPLFTTCSKARATVSPPTWGKIDSKGTLILELDNIKREQTVTIVVDVECPQEISELISITTEPKGILSRTNPSCDVRVFNRRDWPVIGVPLVVQAKIPKDHTCTVSRVISSPPSVTQLTSDTVDIRSSKLGRGEEVSWSTDIGPRKHQNFKVALIPEQQAAS